MEQDRGGEPTLVRLEPSRTERRRHLRKYAEGELPEDRSFYFRGPEGKLNLRAHNLILFMDLGRRRRRRHLAVSPAPRRDLALAAAGNQGRGRWPTQAAAIERNQQLDAAASRRKMRELIEATYTLPAQ